MLLGYAWVLRGCGVQRLKQICLAPFVIHSARSKLVCVSFFAESDEMLFGKRELVEFGEQPLERSEVTCYRNEIFRDNYNVKRTSANGVQRPGRKSRRTEDINLRHQFNKSMHFAFASHSHVDTICFHVS
jgi:hypothetical protein